jgi:hypothetical protein
VVTNLVPTAIYDWLIGGPCSKHYPETYGCLAYIAAYGWLMVIITPIVCALIFLFLLRAREYEIRKFHNSDPNKRSGKPMRH